MKPSPFSALIAGTMTWGIWGKNYDSWQMADLIQACFDMGITSFDFAEFYGKYTTEAGFGKAFKDSGISRITQLQKATIIEMELQDWFSLWTASRCEDVP